MVGETNNPEGVTALIAQTTHQLRPTISAVRQTILAADPAITEGVKWNSPSFYCAGWFATINSRKPDRLDIVFHHGARVMSDASLQQTMADPSQLLHWASADRAIITIRADHVFKEMQSELSHIARQWAAYQKVIAANQGSP